MTKTKVVFRKLLEDNSIIAVFPEQHWNAYGDLASYQHTGQHGAASVDWLRKQTRLATPEEYKELFEELEGIGYSLIVVKCMTGRH